MYCVGIHAVQCLYARRRVFVTKSFLAYMTTWVPNMRRRALNIEQRSLYRQRSRSSVMRDIRRGALSVVVTECLSSSPVIYMYWIIFCLCQKASYYIKMYGFPQMFHKYSNKKIGFWKFYQGESGCSKHFFLLILHLYLSETVTSRQYWPLRNISTHKSCSQG